MKLFILISLLLSLTSLTFASEKTNQVVEVVDPVFNPEFTYIDIITGDIVDLISFSKYTLFFGCDASLLVFPYSCCYAVNTVCVEAFRKNDSSLVEQSYSKIENEVKKRGEKVQQKPLKEALTDELKHVKKDLLNNEEASLEEYRKGKVYTKESLAKEIQKNKILELEKFIQEKKQASKK
jgi:hypothetical protein